MTTSNSMQYWATLVKEVFNLMLGLKSDKMTFFRPNGKLTLTFYKAFENSIPIWSTFAKESFWFDAYLGRWRNDCFVTEQQLNSHFLYHILKYHSKLSNICKPSFFLGSVPASIHGVCVCVCVCAFVVSQFLVQDMTTINYWRYLLFWHYAYLGHLTQQYRSLAEPCHTQIF